ncbi:Mfa1 family fimbria major subunit [Prevotella copri]|uniref:Mfa1 family fimbria major subunit n=1 Tax=Segatella copri TaxID=165179 RepID=UPI001C2CA1A9|nr:Mfa1 family fimbria major subunit [Segatella copri]MBU9908894.1 Mfa1 family fimbria major subunit [Segatella copri]MBV3374342.1 Mfa1 family fimbria major subunit [Segatella copri]
MKKTLLFSVALAGLMLGSCSSSDDLNGGGNNTGFNETGKGYINISLNLPTQGKNVSRAANDVTADGDVDEYNVKDAALLLFAGSNENDAVFQGAYNLEGLKKDISANAQISTQLTKVQEISSISASGKIYAFVLVNKGTKIIVGTDHTITVNGTAFSGNFSDFSKLEVNGAFVKDNLMMTNVPVVTKPGTAAFDDATVLADVTTSIFKTEAEAKANPAADIFVERVASKVTLGQTGSGTSIETLSADGTPAKNFKYTLEGWNLANVNKSSYLVRQYDNSWKDLKSDGTDFLTGADKSAFDANPYRFAGIKLIKTNESLNPAANKYRTYWGKDINYTNDAPFASDAIVGDADLTLEKDASTYCYENTFDVAHQNVCNTTTAIVKMKITPDSYTDGTTFYTINGGKDVVYSLANAKTKVGNQFLAENTESSLKTKYFSTVTEAGKIKVSDVEFSDKAGAVTFTKLVLTFTPTATGSATKTVNVTDAAVLTALANNIKVVEYKDGYSYYNILIKHFGDELTPWNPSTKTSGISYPSSNEANWLGRYGVLRNNWYDLDITGVSRLGAATPEELDVKNDPTPDDNLKSYISVKINVLSWAKRTQGAILGQ